MRRRDVLWLGGALLASAAETRKPQPTICVFSKHLAMIPVEKLGAKSKELGFAGVDLTVRPKGHVLPEDAATKLRPAVEGIRAAGLTVPMITTEIISPTDPYTRPILSQAAALKIPYFKLGYWRYRIPGVMSQLEEVRTSLEAIVRISADVGIEAGFHNHSGTYVGAAVWDTRDLIQNMDPRRIGYYLDPAHATIEGGLGNWKISMDIVTPRLKMVAVKDFYWEKQKGKWAVRWCPMGEGMVDWPQVIDLLAKAKFQGPMTIHVEYETHDEPASLAKDREYLAKLVSKSYGS